MEFNFFTDRPENVKIELTKRGKSATLTCKADGRPEPSYEIFLNETILVKSEKTYTIPKVNSSHGGYYKCVATNKLENASSISYPV